MVIHQAVTKLADPPNSRFLNIAENRLSFAQPPGQQSMKLNLERNNPVLLDQHKPRAHVRT